VRDIDDVHASEVYGESLAHSTNPVFRADKDWNDQACASCLESSPEGGLVAGMRDGSREGLQAFGGCDQAFVFLVLA
jgi:hypothetical protein